LFPSKKIQKTNLVSKIEKKSGCEGIQKMRTPLSVDLTPEERENQYIQESKIQPWNELRKLPVLASGEKKGSKLIPAEDRAPPRI
jgi:hypothetical protein